MTCVADGGLAELARDDVIRECRDVMLRDVSCECFAKSRTEKPAQVARHILPSLQPGPHLAVRLLDQCLHPLDPLLNDLGDRLATLRFRGLLVAEGLGECVATLGPEAVNRAARVLDGEGLGIVDAEPAGALLSGLPVGELEREGRRARRGDADVKTRALPVVDFGPLGDPLLAQAVGQDDAAVAAALADGERGRCNYPCGFGSSGLGPKGSALRSFQLVVRTLKGLGPGP
jgi:hypothetical protein